MVVLSATALAWAEPVTTIRNNGSTSNRVDIVVVGDGYTAAEMAKFATDTEVFVSKLFADQPFMEYRNYFNVHRVDVASAESGADHPDRTPQVFKNTRFDATYNCSGIQRLICVNVSKVNTVLSASVTPEMRDVVLVLVNDPEYGGSGGAVAVASTHADAAEVVLHEIGHSFGLLADEYEGGGPSCNPSVEPSEANATRETSRATIKWRHWIDPSTPVPTFGPSSALPGLYEGSKYCTTGLYRPTYENKMRVLYRPFEQINAEQLVKRVYNWASPIDTTSPAGGSLSLGTGSSQQFSVQTPLPATHALAITWRVDGNTRGTGSQFTLQGSTLSVGSHTVEVRVNDPTTFVRNDPAGVLAEARSWTVTVFAQGTPNLIVSKLGGQSVAGAGLPYDAKDTTQNIGAAGAGASATRFFLSPDATWSAGDTPLAPAAGRAVPALAAGAVSTGTTTLTIPAGTAPGKWYLIARADSAGAVAESDENDNTKAKTINIGPDLRVTALTAPAAANRGATISVTETTQNRGGAGAAATMTRFHLSLNKKVDAGDVLLGGRAAGALAAGASSSGTTSLTIPAGTAPGTYMILAVSDATAVVAESNEQNNIRAATIVVN
jgi:hypothetical protein